ncbi:sulfatase-like hydrolase/transferase [Novipirellula artificiosorum]|uniref:Arylsulfatase n=1 Tax=Novipirellula artificiosorum TaxID=2528016 RepID=A0A5C6DKP1_9BACT|nr:sulfatase-like hydrolase/transferase [Novipirellula artificiosorum]TWU37430.1 Arylsulfatase precursor [Novipirellula artificiosorum]
MRSIYPITRFAFIFSLAFCSYALADSPPNVVVILADDLGIVDINAYAKRFTGVEAGEMCYETPNLDRLVREGMSFSQAYACHLCSPARASLLTGKYTPALNPDYDPEKEARSRPFVDLRRMLLGEDREIRSTEADSRFKALAMPKP